MDVKYVLGLGAGFTFALAGLAFGINLVGRTENWTGFYYRDVQGRTEPLSLILRNPDTRSQPGAFKTLEACQDWAEYVRMKDGGKAAKRDDLVYCARNCKVKEGAGADCGDSEASVFLIGH